MADIGKNALKTKIDDNIYENASQEITGEIMNEVLQDMVDTLADREYQLIAPYVVVPTSTSPSVTDGKVFVFAVTPGTYTNFNTEQQAPDNKIVIGANDGLCVLTREFVSGQLSYWSKTVIGLTGGGSEPDAYIKSASVSQDGNTLTLTKKDNTQVEFSPSSGGSVEIVNDLTTGGVDKALSAEQGKVIGNKLSPITDKIKSFSFITGKYISTTGVETSWAGGSCTDYVDVQNGDILIFTGNGAQARIAAYDADKQFVNLVRTSGGTDVNIIIDNMSIKYVRASAGRYDPYSLSKVNQASIPIIIDRLDKTDERVGNVEDVALPAVAPTENVSVPFDGGNKYIDTGGNVHSSAIFVATQYIPVNEGDEIYYTGKPGSTSLGMAGFVLVDGTFQFVVKLVSTSSSHLSNQYVVIPSGVTHIMAVCSTSDTDRALIYVKQSRLSKIEDSVGNVKSLTRKYLESGHYIDGNGNLKSGGASIIFDVLAGDTIILYDYQPISTGTYEGTISKQLTEDRFEVVVNSRTLEPYPAKTTITYIVPENMTIGVSAYYSYRMLVVKRDRIKAIEINSTKIAEIIADIANTKQAIEDYDMQLGYMCEHIACIGDSMSVGTIGTSTADDKSSYGASWLSDLAKRWGCKGRFHFSVGGSSTYSWLNSPIFGLGCLLAKEQIYNAYFIAYGHNDDMGAGSAEDEAAPVTIVEGNPSCPSGYSFAAYYKAIINQIRTKAPHAMIVCLSEYDSLMASSTKAAYRQAVIDVAEQYYANGDKLVMHLETGGVPVSDMVLGSHYSTIGYMYIAKKVDQEFNKWVYNHRADSEIKFFGGWNTSKNEDSPFE